MKIDLQLIICYCQNFFEGVSLCGSRKVAINYIPIGVTDGRVLGMIDGASLLTTLGLSDGTLLGMYVGTTLGM